MSISFKATREHSLLIQKIATRIVEMSIELNINYDRLDAVMDITACHCNGTLLDLERLLHADDATLGHDVYGIRRHINRRSGELGGCFVPRTSLRELSIPV